ncbi:MAG: hypothetical protein ACREER_05270 [Alphaproteobacteria bacterium]
MAAIVGALDAALRLFRFDGSGIDRFDQSVEGFWRSFAVIPLGVPLVLLASLAVPEPDDPMTGPAAGLLAEAAAYLVGWLFMPVVAVFLTRAYGLAARYVPYVIALNWTSLVGLALAALIAAVVPGGGGPLDVIAVPLLLYLLAVEWFAARTALRTTGWVAATFVAIDVVGSLAIFQLLGVQG